MESLEAAIRTTMARQERIRRPEAAEKILGLLNRNRTPTTIVARDCILAQKGFSDVSSVCGLADVTHTHRWHAHCKSTGSGHLYQGRFKSFPVQDDAHFHTVCRYVERNALRVNLVKRAEDWRWSSLQSLQRQQPEWLVPNGRLFLVDGKEWRDYGGWKSQPSIP